MKRDCFAGLYVVAALLLLLLAAWGPGSMLAEANDATLTPAAWLHLPYLLKPGSAATATPTPTVTLTATATPSATATATPTQLVGVTILPNHSSYVHGSFVTLYGEVQNNTGNHLRLVKISAKLYNAAGQELDDWFAYSMLDNLPPGEKTCFFIQFTKPEDWAYYEFEIPDYRTDGALLPRLVIVGDRGEYDPPFRRYHVIGQVRNEAQARVEYIKLAGTLYDGAGKVIDCWFCFLDGNHLDPGQVGDFKITFPRFYGTGEVAAYRAQVDGRVR